ncbi:unnamed protein product [Mytilus edulis]|uniref:Uncharacterized protein n=1 Tax=Mytilus edulis TaxID=6550 RepID=A0A8S3U767_MYTED|nr:unnamed protein product [Mytilus edulis]
MKPIYHFNTINKDAQSMEDKHNETYLPFQRYKQGYPGMGDKHIMKPYLPFQHYKQGYPEYGDKHTMKPIYHFKHYKQGYPEIPRVYKHIMKPIYHFNTTNKDTQSMGQTHNETYLPFQHYKQGYPEYGDKTHNETYLPFQHYKQGYPEYGDKHIMKPTTNKDTQSMGENT